MRRVSWSEGGEIRKFIGADVRAMRKARGVKLTELAHQIGRSTGWLSQLERGRTNPSVDDLEAIARFFDLDVRFFFRASAPSDEERSLVRRSTDRVKIGSYVDGLKEELLSPGLGGAFQMLISYFEPHRAGKRSIPERSIEEGGVLISGQLTLTVGDVSLELAPGDSFQFADSEYAWANEGDERAVVIWIISPPILR